MRWHTLAIALASLPLLACTGDFTYLEPGPGNPGNGGGDTPDAGGGDMMTARQTFEEDVLPLLMLERPAVEAALEGSCMDCHVNGEEAAPIFLDGDTFDSLVSYLTALPGRALSFPVYPQHTGNGFCEGPGNPADYCSQNEGPIVRNWIDMITE